MRNALYGFLDFPVGVRFAIMLGIFLILYWIFGRLLYNLLSLVPLILKKMIYATYLLIEIPVSALHKSIGGIFSGIDQGIATGFSKVFCGLDKCYKALHKPKTIHRNKAFFVYLICGAYLVVPGLAGISSSIFTFWEGTYLRQEANFVAFIESTLPNEDIPVVAEETLNPYTDAVSEIPNPYIEVLETPTPDPFENLQHGDKGERVTELQEKLKEFGYNVGKIDGVFGRQTEKTVRRFQEDMQLEVSGICDEATWILLFADDS